MPNRILLIEDNLANLELMSYLLRSFGYVPLSALNGAEGVEMARRERPDLIICDVQMPVMDGYEVARHLKSHPDMSTIPLVAVTALARRFQAGSGAAPDIVFEPMGALAARLAPTPRPKVPGPGAL